MRSKFLIAISILVLCSSPALSASDQSALFELESSHSKIGFNVAHLMISSVDGRFEKYEATFEIDKDGILKGVEAKIEVDSINTANKKRDDHLISADFFDAKKFPTILFKSIGVKLIEREKTGAARYELQGDLTIHGVKKKVTLDVRMSAQIKDPWGNTKVGVSATGSISRSDFGITWNKALETGGVLVGDQVTIDITAEGAKLL